LRLERRQRDLVAHALDDLGRIVGDLLLVVVLGLVLELAALELLDAAADRIMVAGEADRGDRLQRIHDRHHVGRAELGLDEAGDLLPARHARLAPHVVVVEKEREQPDIVAGRFGFLVGVGADLPRRRTTVLHQPAVELDETEGLDFLRLAVLGDLEVGGLQVGDGPAVLARGDGVDANEVDAAFEGRLRRLLIGGGRLSGVGRRSRSRGRLILTGGHGARNRHAARQREHPQTRAKARHGSYLRRKRAAQGLQCGSCRRLK
jgi:hypothetical protein